MTEIDERPTYRRLRTPSGTAVCVSNRAEQITIAVGPRQRINCSEEEAHGLWRALTVTLFADGGKAPSWAMRIPEASQR